ncbi:hypothetical protein FOZ63_006706, partial [Perkinsus olseni]
MATGGANNANDIVSSPVLILIIVAMTLFFTFGALMALRAPSGSKWRAIILPKMGVIFASLLVWFVFTGSDVYTVLILCIPVAGPMLAALWLWYRDRRRARRNRKAAEKLAQAARQQSLFIDVEEGEGFRLMDRTRDYPRPPARSSSSGSSCASEIRMRTLSEDSDGEEGRFVSMDEQFEDPDDGSEVSASSSPKSKQVRFAESVDLSDTCVDREIGGLGFLSSAMILFALEQRTKRLWDGYYVKKRPWGAYPSQRVNFT